MSEKRFYLLSYKNYPIYDSVEDKEYNARFRKQREKLCDLLNEWVTKCNQLESENEQLRNERTKTAKELSGLFKQNGALKRENEQLKEELNNLKKDETMLYHYYTLARYGGDGV